MRSIRIQGLALRAIVVLAVLPSAARADFKVHLPDAETGEWEIEEIGSYGNSGNPATSNEQSFVHEFGYGINDWWHTELEFETDRLPGTGNHLKFDQLTSENQFVFGERGQYWLDPGWFWEYGQGLANGNPNETTFGPTLRKQIGPTINTVNLFLEKEFGRGSDGHLIFSYAWETRLALRWPIDPGLQAYGTPGPLGKFTPISQQHHRAGPQLFGEIHQIGPGTLKWNAGVLFGMTPSVPRQTWRWQLEYEIHF